MSIQVRDLLPKVMVHRPDLDDERGMWALRESALRVAKETLLATNETATYVEPNSRIFTPVVSGEQVIRFTSLATANPDGITEFVGDYNAALDIPELPLPLAQDVGDDTFKHISNALGPRAYKFSLGRYAVTGNGDLYVTNGAKGVPTGEMFRYRGGTFTKMADPPLPRGMEGAAGDRSVFANNEMVVLDDGRIVDFGSGASQYVGGFYTANDRSMSIYDPDTDTWTNYLNCFPYNVGGGCMYFYMGGSVIGIYTGSVGQSASGPDLSAQTSVGIYGYIVLFDVDTRTVTERIQLPFTPPVNTTCYMSHVNRNKDEVLFCAVASGDAGNLFRLYSFSRSTKKFTAINTAVDSGAAGLYCPIRDIGLIDDRYFYAITSDHPNYRLVKVDITTGVASSYVTLPEHPNGDFTGAIGVSSDGLSGAFLTNTGYYYFYLPESNSFTTATLLTGYVSVGQSTRAILSGAPFIVGSFFVGYNDASYFDMKRTANIGDSYLVTTPGNGLYAGDILTSDGTNWNVTTTTGYQNTYQANIPSNNMAINGKVSDGVTSWAQDNGSIYWYGDTSSGFFAKTRYSYVPTDRDFDEIGLPTEAEDAVVEGALELVYMMPGPSRDPNMATYYRRTYKTAVSQLRAVQMFGYGGSPTFNAPFFAGRPTYGTGW